MNKDIIYIDVEDDVTSVIGKVRGATEKIVALVPPKNIGALQSAVNLRLLQKAADGAGKRIVLITNNSGLTALAAGVKIPVAKNLQSKPEIPAAPDRPEADDDDVIKGEELPVGELAAATADASAIETAVAKPIVQKPSDDDISLGDLPDLDAPAAVAATGTAKVAKNKAKGSRVPNFGRFRKWIFIGGGAVVAIVLFFVLTNVFLTGANIVITAQTSSIPITQSLTLTTTGPTNINTNTIQASTKQTQKTESVTFTPTGTLNTGSKATGTLTLSNASSSDPVTIPAGTTFSGDISGQSYTTDKDVTIAGATLSHFVITPKTAQVGMTATAGGTKYNAAAQTYSTTSDVSGVTATGSATSGGTDNNVTIVTDADIAKAESTITTNTSDATAAKTQLTDGFGSTYVVIGSSFTAQAGTATPTPASGQQATSGKVSVITTYSLVALPKSQISTVTKDYLNSQMSGDNQKIYDDGSAGATVSGFVTSPSGLMTLNLNATGKVGPNIDDATVKKEAVGQKVEQIRQEVESINGVKDVNVSFAPFWRSTAPSADKIKVSFNLNSND